MIVIDASLAVKLVLAEHDSDRVEAWLGSIGDPLAAPDLIMLEVAQSVVRRVNGGELPEKSGHDALRRWRAVVDGGAIELFRVTPSRVATAAELAIRLRHPTADCLYLGLANETGSDLLTADAKFVARAGGDYPRVKLLDEAV